jgi:hypothetical protein
VIRFSGGDSEVATPVPIPNTVVKHLSGDGTAPARVWESSTLPEFFRARIPPGVRALFLAPRFPALLDPENFLGLAGTRDGDLEEIHSRRYGPVAIILSLPRHLVPAGRSLAVFQSPDQAALQVENP